MGTYEGEPLRSTDKFDFANTDVVIVSGDELVPPWVAPLFGSNRFAKEGNYCGHMLLNPGGKGQWYLHVTRLYDYPLVMGESGFRGYLKAAKKLEMIRRHVMIPNPNGAKARLAELTKTRWLWLGTKHNCASFAEEVIRAGGSSLRLNTCPIETAF
jgi:hypothetical protein